MRRKWPEAPAMRSALALWPAAGMAVEVAFTTFRKSFTRRRYARLQQSSGEQTECRFIATGRPLLPERRVALVRPTLSGSRGAAMTLHSSPATGDDSTRWLR